MLHNKCNKTKTSYLTDGRILNGYLVISIFDDEKEYRVCLDGSLRFDLYGETLFGWGTTGEAYGLFGVVINE